MDENVYKFPLMGNNVYSWFSAYRIHKTKYGDLVANDWLIKNVPSQFHKQIHTMYYNWRLNRGRL